MSSSQAPAPPMSADRPRLGERIVRMLGIPEPEDPLERRAQQAFALVQVGTALSFLVQAAVIGAVEGLTLTAAQVRIAGCIATALMLGSTLLLSRAGHSRLAARATGVGVLLLLLAFGATFGLRESPAPFVFSMALLGALVLTERPRFVVWWSIAFISALAFGVVVEPTGRYVPNRLSLLSGVVLSAVFFAVYLVEFRSALAEVIESLLRQTTRLRESNQELEESLSARDALSAQLANAQRLEAMGRMAGSIAHDFNNQLTVIRGYADLVAKGLAPGSARQAEMGQLVSAVSRASTITRDVLDFASPHGFPLDATDVAALVRTLAPDLTQLLAPDVALRVELPSSPVYAMTDRAQLERLLMNLTLNARDVTPPGGSVALSVQGVDQRVVCRVVDGGPGVPAHLREQIFEPFFTTKGTTGGTGLGLASAFVIARKHGGMLQVGDSVGGGATFTLELPRIAPPGRSSTASVTTASATPIRAPVALPELLPGAAGPPVAVRVRARAPLPAVPAAPVIEMPEDTSTWLAGLAVLVVEDDLQLSGLVARFLEAAGATVHAIDNGEDAVTYLRGAIAAGTPLDVVVTDLRMPRGSGAAVIAAARERATPLPIVAMSGYLDDAVVAALAARRVLYFLAKPFTERQLHLAIAVAQRYAESDVRA